MNRQARAFHSRHTTADLTRGEVSVTSAPLHDIHEDAHHRASLTRSPAEGVSWRLKRIDCENPLPLQAGCSEQQQHQSPTVPVGFSPMDFPALALSTLCVTCPQLFQGVRKCQAAEEPTANRPGLFGCSELRTNPAWIAAARRALLQHRTATTPLVYSAIPIQTEGFDHALNGFLQSSCHDQYAPDGRQQRPHHLVLHHFQRTEETTCSKAAPLFRTPEKNRYRDSALGIQNCLHRRQKKRSVSQAQTPAEHRCIVCIYTGDSGHRRTR